MKKGMSKFKIFRYLCLFFYLLCIIVLIVESCMDGKSSAKQSNAIGGGIADIVNDIGGDQTVVINPTKVEVNNKIDTATVFSSYQLYSTIYPANATYKSLIYESSDESIASISSTGQINFLNVGEVTFTIKNEKKPELFDQFTVMVNHIEVSEITYSLNAERNDDIYILYLEDEYKLDVTYEPLDATNKDLSFTLDSNKYLSITENGTIIPLNYSNGVVTTIKVKVGSFEKIVKLVVEIKDKIELERIEPTSNHYELYETESKKINFNFYPSNATFKDYTLTTADNSTIKISGSTIKGLSAGDATITVTSKMNPEISSNFTVTVKERENIKEFELSKTNLSLNIGSTSKIKVSIISPNRYALLSSLTYTSSNPTIASVTESGLIKALSDGTVTITVSNSDNTCIKEITIEVIKYTPPIGTEQDSETIGMDLELLKGPYITTKSSYNLTTLISVSKYYNLNNDQDYTPKNLNLSYEITSETTNIIQGNSLIVNEAGEITIKVTHISSGITRAISLIVLDKIEILKDNTFLTTTNINLLGNSEFNFIISNNKDNYYIRQTSTSLGNLKAIDDHNYQFLAYNTEGIITIEIIPLYDHQLIESKKIEITINIYNIKTTKLDIEIYNQTTSDELLIKNNEINAHVNDKLMVKVILDEFVNLSNVTFTSSNNSLLDITTDGKINVKKHGNVTLTIEDKITNIKQELIIHIYNIIKIDETNQITFKGQDASYNEATNTYQLLNGHSGSVKINFSADTTYQKIDYYSSNNKVISVGKDGTLTPHKEGTSTITLTISDGMTDNIVITIKVKVNPQVVVKDLSYFLHKIRKGLGHFGAFLVFGIFSTLTFMLFFRYKKWAFSVPVCFIQGFGIAALTEYIQTFVPGRCGLFSDVIIDFTGFCFSAIILTISILIFYLVKHLKSQKAE